LLVVLLEIRVQHTQACQSKMAGRPGAVAKRVHEKCPMPNRARQEAARMGASAAP